MFVMTQREAVVSWWCEADEPTRRRALRLAEDMQHGLVKAGVSVVPLGRSGVDLGPLGYLQPDELVDFLADQR